MFDQMNLLTDGVLSISPSYGLDKGLVSKDVDLLEQAVSRKSNLRSIDLTCKSVVISLLCIEMDG